MPIVTRCTSDHAEEWDAFVARVPSATFYHRWSWKTLNERQLGHDTAYLAGRVDGRMTGVLPMVCVDTWLFGTIACTMPFVNYGGPASDDADTDRALVEAAIAQARAWRADYLELRTRHPLGGDLAVSQHKVSLTLELASDAEVLWNRFKTGHRQEIRRAAKNGLSARFGPELLDAFYSVVAESWHELGTPFYRKRYFEDVLHTFGDDIRICVLFDRAGRPAAAAMDGLHRDTVEGMWLGIRPQYRKQLAGYALYWELIKDACERGFKVFHLGRSTADSGAETFKKKWLAEAQPLFWHYHLQAGQPMPGLNVQNPKYQLAMKLWRQLPPAVVGAVGPSIARGLP